MTQVPSQTVAVVGGGGYVGAVLIPKLLKEGHTVKVIDLFIYGEDVFNGVQGHPKLQKIKGDVRDAKLMEKSFAGCDAVIHLACISNDPSFELNPDLGKSINYDSFGPTVDAAKNQGVRRFIYASSSSVYGVKSVPNVTEELSLEPLTDYSKYKAMCEEVLLKKRSPGFVTLILRPATVCGYSPRLRLDLTVNLLTNHAVNNKKILVFGGNQLRPNLHIEDMADLYVETLKYPDAAIDGETFNAGYDNFTVMQIAEFVQGEVGGGVEIVVQPTNDNRSYMISSEKIKKKLGFAPKRTVVNAIQDLVTAFRKGLVPDAMKATRYYNIKRMQELNLR